MRKLGKLISKLFTKPWLRAWSGLLINFSAALFIIPITGYTILFPQNLIELGTLFADLLFGIMFLILTVKCEERLKR